MGQRATSRRPVGVPAVVFGTAAAEGTSEEALRKDCTILAFDAIAPTTQGIADAASVGSAAVAARRDHKHGMPAAAAASIQSIGDTAIEGVATTLARSDHKHGMPAAGTPIVQAYSDTAAEGVASTLARSDHRHGMPAAPALSLLMRTAQISHALATTYGAIQILDGASGTDRNILKIYKPADFDLLDVWVLLDVWLATNNLRVTFGSVAGTDSDPGALTESWAQIASGLNVSAVATGWANLFIDGRRASGPQNVIIRSVAVALR